MARHYKKPPVRPEVARKWLQRHEVDGESVPQIAKIDGYDVRTVRRQLDLMTQERENREARQTVLRQALERHYADLCAFAEQIKATLSGNTPTVIPDTLKENPLWAALRQHLPRLPLWKDIEKLSILVIEFNTATDKIRQRVIREAALRSSLEFIFKDDVEGLLAGGFDGGIIAHLQSVARGENGLELTTYKKLKGKVGIRLERGSFGLAEVVNDDKTNLVERIFDALMIEALDWEEYFDLKRNTEQFLRIKENVTQEMTKIMLRRVVPGRCTYCPI